MVWLGGSVGDPGLVFLAFHVLLVVIEGELGFLQCAYAADVFSQSPVFLQHFP